MHQALADELAQAVLLAALADEDALSSTAWLELGKRLQAATWAMASLVYRAREWQEPDDERADRTQPPESELRWLWRGRG